MFDDDFVAETWNDMVAVDDINYKLSCLRAIEAQVATIRYKHRNAVLAQIHSVKSGLQRLVEDKETQPKNGNRSQLATLSDLFKDILSKCDIPAELDTPLLNLCRNKAISCDDVLTILRTIPDDALAIIRTLESRSDASSEAAKPEPIPISLNKIESILKSCYVTSRKGEKVNDSKTEQGWKDYATKCRDTIRRLSNEFPDTLHLWKLNDLVDYIMSKQRCGHEWSASTAKTHLSHINTLFVHLTSAEKNRYGVDPDHLDYIRENQILCSEIISEVYENQRLTQAEEKLTMSQEDLVTATDKYEQENPVTQIKNHADFVVARTIFLGRVNVKDHQSRRLDSLTPKITSITPQDNYIDWDTGCLVLNDYKTVKMYGTYKMKLSDETLRIAALMRDYILKQGKQHLVGCDDNVRNYSYMLQDAFRRICGRPLSCNLLRKMYINHA
ncbi:hypothetical protein BC832DRAFT_594556 [Gaertneriomyces semiglobifer]|nr:hypothetical protein BC832DRAFT_594556 [Gaertneriomyces semiglobifer]